jgi:IS5 family transposase
MRPKEQRETGEQDLFRARLDQIIDVDHALVRLGGRSIGGSWKGSWVRFTPTNPAVHRCRPG